MRIGLIVIGVLLVALGVAALTGNLDFTRDKEVLKIGELSATVARQETIPQWAGALGVLAGLGLIGAGAMRKR